MTRAQLETEFRSLANSPIDLEQVRTLAGSLKSAGRKASAAQRICLAAQLAHGAFLAPEERVALADEIEAALSNAIRGF